MAEKKYKKPTTITKEDGTVVTLLNPHLKNKKYFKENKKGIKYTNAGKVKKNENGKAIKLSDTEKAWRSGYNKAMSDSAKCYKAIKKKKANKKG